MSECPYKLRSDIPEPPPALAHLPIGRRGYPVPPFVKVLDGEPDFRIMDPEFVARAHQRKLCFICGKPRGSESVFVVGPLSLLNRLSVEPPSHTRCARYATQACPFIVKPQMQRRPHPDSKKIMVTQVADNPGIYALAFTRGSRVEIFPDGNPRWFFDFYAVEWVRGGRQATRADVAEGYAYTPDEIEACAAKEGITGVQFAQKIDRTRRWWPR